MMDPGRRSTDGFGTRGALLGTLLLVGAAGAAALAAGALGGGDPAPERPAVLEVGWGGDSADRTASAPSAPERAAPGAERRDPAGRDEEGTAPGRDARPEGGEAAAGRPAAPNPESAAPKPGSAEPAPASPPAQAGADPAPESPAQERERGPDSVGVETLLAEAEAAYGSLRSLRARFSQTVEVPLLDRRREGHGIWYQEGRGHFKMEFREPREDVVVADGTYLWLYYPSSNPRQVIKADLASEPTEAGTADVLARILSEARTAYTATYEGREEVSGVATDRISLVPIGRSPYRRVRVWIGTSDRLVRRFQILEENETLRTVTLRDLEPNAPIPAGTFVFRPPPDADVFER